MVLKQIALLQNDSREVDQEISYCKNHASSSQGTTYLFMKLVMIRGIAMRGTGPDLPLLSRTNFVILQNPMRNVGGGGWGGGGWV